MEHGMLVHTETDERGIEYRLFIQQDESEVRGNAPVSGFSVEASYKGFSGWDHSAWLEGTDHV